jgi:diguanylate cyclase
MSFFNNKDDSPEKWKEKYFTLLDSQDQSEKDHKANEDLLCKTIIRFALAVKGLNSELDPHLNRIRDLLKGGLQSQQLQKELEAFSNALILLEEKPASRHVDASLLFEFLCKQYPRHKVQLDDIQEKYQRQEFINSQGLFIALLELIDDRQLAHLDFVSELAAADLKAINTHLVRLLDHADIPELFADQAQQIKVRLQAETGAETLGPILDDTVGLVLAVKKHLELEQLEMADFLSKLTEQLAELGLKATGVNIANENTIKKRTLLDQTVSQQMVDLQNKSASATQLEPLKQLVHSRLTNISHQIQMHNLQEQIEREESQRELRALSQRIREMEAESTELRSRLDIAQHNAARDPLTHLPNRLAFEERLAGEVARWKRHAMPLSMVIWDIDFFKKINDSYGHKSGDKALVAIAQLLSRHCRESDFVARFGGEEFVMLLPDTDALTAQNVANKLRETIHKANFRVAGDKVSITLSCGISQIVEGDSHETIFERADKALYKAKQNGRNQCVVIL